MLCQTNPPPKGQPGCQVSEEQYIVYSNLLCERLVWSIISYRYNHFMVKDRRNKGSRWICTNYLIEGAMKEDAALWRILIPINRIKAALSCSKTNFTVVPENIKFPFILYAWTFRKMKSQGQENTIQRCNTI